MVFEVMRMDEISPGRSVVRKEEGSGQNPEEKKDQMVSSQQAIATKRQKNKARNPIHLN